MGKNSFETGWNYSSKIIGSQYATSLSQAYVGSVQKEIDDLANKILNHTYKNAPLDTLQGYMFEEFSAGTFNINSVAAGSEYRAEVLGRKDLGSVDIEIKDGKKNIIKSISAKSWKDGAKSAIAQAKLNPETGQALYLNQERLVPSDQIVDARATAHRRSLENKEIRPNLAKAYSETEKKLTTKIESPDGVSSIESTREQHDALAKDSQEGTFDPEKYDVTLSKAIDKYILKQAFKAGCTTAFIAATLQMAPEIYKALDCLIKNGEIDPKQLLQCGEKGITASAEGFLQGSITYTFCVKCAEGSFGESLKTMVLNEANTSIIAIAVTIVLQTVKNSILVAAGKMTPQQMGEAFTDSVIISGGYLLGAKIGGAIGQAIGFELPVVGYILGSLIGTAFCAVYKVGKKKFLSICVDTGFACFGLVDQDYSMPVEYLHELGIEIVLPDFLTPDYTEPDYLMPDYLEPDYLIPETIEFKTVRRGLIGVNKVGYVLD